MRVKSFKTQDGKWVVIPQAGRFEGRVIGQAEGLSMKAVEIDGLMLSGEMCAVWGLDMTEAEVFQDPVTVRGLRIGCNFDMRNQNRVDEEDGRYVIADSGVGVTRAKNLWMVGHEMQSFGEELDLPRRRSSNHP
jgi:hypothetical protein